MRVYVDTCVWISLFKGEKSRYIDNDQVALNIFNRALDREFKIIVSDWLLFELKKATPKEHMHLLHALLNKLHTHKAVVHVIKDAASIQVAKQSPTHWQDALHVVLAKKAKADVLLTWNIKDFYSLRTLLEIKLPYEF